VSRLVGRVVVGVHGTPGSLQALRFAVGHARAFGATLIPVIAWLPPGGDSAGRHYPLFLTQEWAEAAEQRLLTAFDEGLGAAPQDLQVEPRVVRGRAGRVLVALAERENDLLVLGESHRGRLHRAWYGCAPRYCLAHAHCAVILISPSDLVLELGQERFLPAWRKHRSPPRDASAAERMDPQNTRTGRGPLRHGNPPKLL
jgi:nucleotide-binding universal stress UspA family protein